MYKLSTLLLLMSGGSFIDDFNAVAILIRFSTQNNYIITTRKTLDLKCRSASAFLTAADSEAGNVFAGDYSFFWLQYPCGARRV